MKRTTKMPCGTFAIVTYSAAIISSVLSWIGCVLIFVAWFLCKETGSSSRRFLLFLTLADFLVAVGNFMGASASLLGKYNTIDQQDEDCDVDIVNNTCIIQSFMSTYASLASFFWNCFVALKVRQAILKTDTVQSWLDRREWPAHVVSWGIPLVITYPLLATGNLGEDLASITNGSSIASGGWCWIRSSDCDLQSQHGQPPRWPLVIFMMTVSGKGWEILAYVFIPVVYFQMKSKLKRTIRHTTKLYINKNTIEAVKRADRVMTLVPLLFLCLRIWGTIRFVANTIVWVTQSNPGTTYEIVVNHIFWLLQAIGDSGQGFVNCIIYCFMTTSIRQKLLERLYCRGAKSPEKLTELEPGDSFAADKPEPEPDNIHKLDSSDKGKISNSTERGSGHNEQSPLLQRSL